MLRTTIATFYRYRSITLFMEIWFNDRFSFRRKLLHVENNVLKWGVKLELRQLIFTKKNNNN